MTDDDPLDLARVAADEAALERARTAGAAEDDDPGLSMLVDLLRDVSTETPQAAPLGHGSSTVLTLDSESTPDRRLARNSGVVALLTAGVLTLGGVAAASTLVPQDNPLHGLGTVVRAAAGVVVGAVTLPEAPVEFSDGSRPGAASVPSSGTPGSAAAAPAPPGVARTPAPGATVAAVVRSQAAVRQLTALLDAAEALLADGRTTAAGARLDTAERRLAEVLPADAAPLEQRLAELRRRAEEPAAQPAPAPASDRPAPPGKPDAKPGARSQAEPDAKPDPEPEAQSDAEPDTTSRQPQRTPPAKGDGGGKGPDGQLTRDAAAQPRV